jgi:hypothetical protein
VCPWSHSSDDREPPYEGYTPTIVNELGGLRNSNAQSLIWPNSISATLFKGGLNCYQNNIYHVSYNINPSSLLNEAGNDTFRRYINEKRVKYRRKSIAGGNATHTTVQKKITRFLHGVKNVHTRKPYTNQSR